MADHEETESVAISDMTYAAVTEMDTSLKEGKLLKWPSSTWQRDMGMKKQRFIVLQSNRLLWFKNGDNNDCILGEIPITAETELTTQPASLMTPELMTVTTGSVELDLMAIQAEDLDEWHEALKEQIAELKKSETPPPVQTSADNDASLAPVGCEGLCRAAAGCLHMLAPPKAARAT